MTGVAVRGLEGALGAGGPCAFGATVAVALVPSRHCYFVEVRDYLNTKGGIGRSLTRGVNFYFFSAVRLTLAPETHVVLLCLEDRFAQIICGKFRNEEAEHKRRLCSVEPHLQQRGLHCMQTWRRASCVKMGVYRDVRVDHVVHHSTYYRIIIAIGRPEAMIDGRLDACLVDRRGERYARVERSW